jgi:hypothetical protein
VIDEGMAVHVNMEVIAPVLTGRTASSPSIIGDYCVFNWTEIMLSIFYKSQLLFHEKPFNSSKKYSESDI